MKESFVPAIEVDYDIKKDIGNRRGACNREVNAGGKNWKENAMNVVKNPKDKFGSYITSQELENVFENTKGKNRNEAYLVFQDIINKIGLDEIKSNIPRIQSFLSSEEAKEALKKLEEITGGYKIPFEKIFIHLTSFPRCPLNEETGEFRVNFRNQNAHGTLRIVLHETLHFIFNNHFKYIIKDFENHFGSKELAEKQMRHLREAQTVILNSEFKNFFGNRKDMGYPKHQHLREEFTKIWNTGEGLTYKQRFQNIVDFGASYLKESPIE